MRIMGLDIGDKRIGVALSDPTGMLASPNTIIERTDESDDINAIVKIIDQYQVRKVIIGLPILLTGRIGEQAEKVHAFAEHLVRHTATPVDFRDERMTTVSAKRLIQEGRNKKGKKHEWDDSAAAAVLLQSYLDEVELNNPGE